jgi:hypothetical protein
MLPPKAQIQRDVVPKLLEDITVNDHPEVIPSPLTFISIPNLDIWLKWGPESAEYGLMAA